MYNCICILPFLGFEDTAFANFASTSHIFDNVRMLPIKILHLQFPKIHYRRYRRSISFEFYLLHNLSQYITYPKIYALMCLPLMESEQEFLYQFFVRNVLSPGELNSKPHIWTYNCIPLRINSSCSTKEPQVHLIHLIFIYDINQCIIQFFSCCKWVPQSLF